MSSIIFEEQSSHNSVIIGNDVTARNLKIIFRGNNNKLIIEDNVSWSGHILIHGDHRSVTIGRNSVSRNVYVLSRDCDITIGSDCLLSRNIEIRASDVHRIYDIKTGDVLNPPGDVHIGNHVWIGANVTISKDSRISDGSVVGANSFVNKKFETKNVVIAGIPAGIVKSGIRWER